MPYQKLMRNMKHLFDTYMTFLLNMRVQMTLMLVISFAIFVLAG